MKIAVFGASGGVGQHIVEQALKNGHHVRALYRSGPIAQQKGLEIVTEMDLLKPETITEVIRGCDVVVSAIGLRRKHPLNPFSKIISPTNLTRRFATLLAESISKLKIPTKVIAISAGGVGDSWNKVTLPLRLLFRYSNIGIAYKDLNLMEEVYSRSNLDWICIRPTTLNNGSLSKRVQETGHYRLNSQVCRADVAWYMLQCIEGTVTPSKRTPMVCN